jgi:hypothetical protein
MPMPQQLPQITIGRVRHPYPPKAVLQQQPQQQLRILSIRLLLAHSFRADLGCVPDPQLKLQLVQQTLKPACVPAGFHPHSHVLSRERAIKLLGFFVLPPSPTDAVALTYEKGFDIAKNEFVSTCGPDALATCVDFNRFNTAAYDLLDQQRAMDALVLFQLNAWAHPKSADAQDSLADGYIAVKSMGNARQALENAVALAQSDPSLDPGARASFVADETAMLLRLK